MTSEKMQNTALVSDEIPEYALAEVSGGAQRTVGASSPSVSASGVVLVGTIAFLYHRKGGLEADGR